VPQGKWGKKKEKKLCLTSVTIIGFVGADGRQTKKPVRLGAGTAVPCPYNGNGGEGLL